MRPLGCVSALFGGDLGAALASIARSGYEEVELWSAPNQCQHVHLKEDRPEKVAEQLSAAGLRASALSLYGRRGDELYQGLEWAARANIPRVVFESSWPDFPSFLRPYLARAEELGVTVCIENHVDRPIDSIRSMVQLLSEVGSPALGLAYAPIHTVALGESVDEALRELREWIRLFYVWDVPRQMTGVAWLRDHWRETGLDQLPGYGGLDFAVLGRSLPDSALSVFAEGMSDWPPGWVESELVRSRGYLRDRGWAV
jgi:sugar phosphate isomerase/epimerase